NGATGRPLLRTLVALTLISGLVDAVSYLGLGHVFTANMTGNVVVLGFAAAGAAGFSVLASLTSLGAFLLAALCAGCGARNRRGLVRLVPIYGHRDPRLCHGRAQRDRPAARRARYDDYRPDYDPDRPGRGLAAGGRGEQGKPPRARPGGRYAGRRGRGRRDVPAYRGRPAVAGRGAGRRD